MRRATLRPQYAFAALTLLALLVLAVAATQLRGRTSEYHSTLIARPVYVASETSFETQRLINSLFRMIQGETRADDVRFRFELLFSRYNVLTQGTHAVRSYTDVPSIAVTVDQLGQVLMAMEDRVASLDTADRATASALLSELRVLEEPLRDMVITVHRANTQRGLELAAQIQAFQRAITAVAIVTALLLPVMIAFFVMDFRSQRRDAAEKQELYTRAEQANRAKGQFLANMSHEIRSPLNGILGVAEILTPTLTTDHQRDLMQVIHRSGELLLTLLNNLLDMSKIEAGRMELDRVAFQPQRLLDEIEPIYAHQAAQKGLRFAAHCGGDCGRARVGDLHRIQQILHNLLSNAVKFTQEGSVDLRLHGEDDGPFRIEVQDTGIGMSAAQTARVFEPFNQADESVTRRFGGTGLGLSVVRELAELMGGSLEVHSTPGEGTRIAVELPLPTTDASSIAVDGAAPLVAPKALKGLRVLIADDSKTNLLVVTQMLRDLRMVITTVDDGEEAVQVWRQAAAESGGAAPFDLLLLDIHMPIMDGLTALEQIRRMEAEIPGARAPAVAITANVMPRQVNEYLAAGFDAFIGKPLQKRPLYATLLSALDRGQTVNAARQTLSQEA